jgi:hypothetical protein
VGRAKRRSQVGSKERREPAKLMNGLLNSGIKNTKATTRVGKAETIETDRKGHMVVEKIGYHRANRFEKGLGYGHNAKDVPEARETESVKDGRAAANQKRER